MDTRPNNLDWETIKYFQPEEWPKNPGLVNPELVHLVDELRDFVGQPIVIHVAWEPSGHAQNSEHYIGLAVDLHITNTPLVDQWLAAERFPFRGIGLYPFWNNPGLHLDLRKGRRNAGQRWWRDSDGQYKALDRALLNKLLEDH